MPPSTRASLPKRSKLLERCLASAEDTLRRKLDFEEIRAFALDGTELARHTSRHAGAVYISDEVGERYKDAVVTHNHPNEGVGLSYFDVRTAIDFDWDEIRAVDAKRQLFTDSLRRPLEGWENSQVVADAWRAIRQRVEGELRWFVAAGRMTHEQAAFNQNHEILKRLSARLDWTYQRTYRREEWDE